MDERQQNFWLAMGGVFVAVGGILVGFRQPYPGWVFIIVGLYVFAALHFRLWLPRPRIDEIRFPDITIHSGGTQYRRDGLVMKLSSPPVEAPLPPGCVAVELMNVLIVNRESSRAASLSFQMYGRIKPGSFGSMEWMPMGGYPPTTLPLASPLNVAAGTSAGGHIAFIWYPTMELDGDDIADDGVTRIDVTDHISGVTIQLDRFARYPPLDTSS